MARRVLMVVHGPYPVGEPRVAREAAAARDAGFEIDVLCMRRAGEPAHELIDGIRVTRLPLARRREQGAAGMVAEYLGFTAAATAVVARRSLRRRRYDVVHVHNPPDFLAAAALVPRLLGARIVLDVHDLSEHMFGVRFGHGPGAQAARRILRAVERMAARLADAVLTVHEPYRDELVAHGVDPAKITVVMNTLDERLLPGPASPRAGGTPRVVYHGTITNPYGVSLLVAAASLLRDRGFAFAVELYGEGDALPRVRDAVDAAGLAAAFHFSGAYLQHDDVLGRVAGAAVGVVPNLPTELNRFALSSKLFEYVVLGIPVVSADLPTLRAHFSDDEVLYFRAGDAGALADALAATFEDPPAAAARAARARARYAEYRWPVHAARYVGVLRRLAGA